ncbi:MAG: hypothetical protein K8L99_32280 [Anaerolineae bacterium]|nr:hypothetical protein [Anaerolineae bacterium]
MIFILLIFPTTISSQSDDFIELNFDSPIGNVTWSPTGSKLAFATGETVHIYDRIGQDLQTIYLDSRDEPMRINDLIWSESERYIAVLNSPAQALGLTITVDVDVYSVEDGTHFLDLFETLGDNLYISGSIYHVDFSSDDRNDGYPIK